MKTIIHVNGKRIISNKRNGNNEPVVAVWQKGKRVYCNGVKIHGPSELIYSGNECTLTKCGARVVIVTDSKVEMM